MGWRGQDMLGVVSTRQPRPRLLFSLMSFRCHNLLDRTFDPLSVSGKLHLSQNFIKSSGNPPSNKQQVSPEIMLSCDDVGQWRLCCTVLEYGALTLALVL